jgi:hypothetical protein
MDGHGGRSTTMSSSALTNANFSIVVAATSSPPGANPNLPARMSLSTTPGASSVFGTPTRTVIPERLTQSPPSLRQHHQDEDVLKDVLDELDRERSRLAELEATVRTLQHKLSNKSNNTKKTSRDNKQRGQVIQKKEGTQQSGKSTNESVVTKDAIARIEAQVRGYQELLHALTESQSAIGAAADSETEDFQNELRGNSRPSQRLCCSPTLPLNVENIELTQSFTTKEKTSKIKLSLIFKVKDMIRNYYKRFSTKKRNNEEMTKNDKRNPSRTQIYCQNMKQEQQQFLTIQNDCNQNTVSGPNIEASFSSSTPSSQYNKKDLRRLKKHLLNTGVSIDESIFEEVVTKMKIDKIDGIYQCNYNNVTTLNPLSQVIEDESTFGFDLFEDRYISVVDRSESQQTVCNKTFDHIEQNRDTMNSFSPFDETHIIIDDFSSFAEDYIHESVTKNISFDIDAHCNDNNEDNVDSDIAHEDEYQFKYNEYENDTDPQEEEAREKFQKKLRQYLSKYATSSKEEIATTTRNVPSGPEKHTFASMLPLGYNWINLW